MNEARQDRRESPAGPPSHWQQLRKGRWNLGNGILDSTGCRGVVGGGNGDSRKAGGAGISPVAKDSRGKGGGETKCDNEREREENERKSEGRNS